VGMSEKLSERLGSIFMQDYIGRESKNKTEFQILIKQIEALEDERDTLKKSQTYEEVMALYDERKLLRARAESAEAEVKTLKEQIKQMWEGINEQNKGG
jgi:hypothetical protein